MKRFILKKRALYVVTGIEGEKITVSPVSESAFSQQKKEGISFPQGIEVLNPQKFKIEKGSLVYVALSKQLKRITGAVVLFFPVIAAFALFILSNPIANIFRTESTEGLKFTLSLSAFLLTAMIEFFLTRNIETILKPIITGVK